MSGEVIPIGGLAARHPCGSIADRLPGPDPSAVSCYYRSMRTRSLPKTSYTRTIVALLLLLGTPSAMAATVAVDREQMQRLLQSLVQQLAIAQQQLSQSPSASVQFAAVVQQLQATQSQIAELSRQIGAAPQYPGSGPQYPQTAPQYPQPGPQYPSSAPQYPQPGPQYPSAPQYTQPGPQYPSSAPQYPQPAPQYPQTAPQYPQPTPQYPQTAPQYPQPAPQYPQPPAPQYPQPVYQNPISDANLRTLLQQISSASYSSEKLNALRQGVTGNYFLVEQIGRILPLYVYITDRVAALQILTPQIIDHANSGKLLSLFQSGTDRDQAQRILEGVPPPAR